MQRKLLSTTVLFGAVASLFGGNSAQAQTVTSPQTSQVALTNDGDALTVTSSGAINYDGTGASPYAVAAGQTTGHVSIDNAGAIVDTLNVASPTATNVSAIRFAALAGTSFTINNSGLISAAHLMGYSANQTSGRTGATDFTNSGTVSSFTSGGGVTLPIPSGTIVDKVAMLFGRGNDTLTNSGTINGDVFMGLGDDIVNIETHSVINGTVYGDDGSISFLEDGPSGVQFAAEGGTINFIGSINTKTSQQTIGDTSGPDYAVYGFKNVHFQSGYWTLAGDVEGALFTVDAGATVELHDSDARFNEFVYGAFNDLGTALVNNGHIIFYNDLTTLSTDDGLNINTSGSGSLDLYNTDGTNGEFLFAATGGFGGGLNLHGGTVILTSNYTGNITVLDGGTLRIGANLVDDPNPLADPTNVIVAPGGGTTGNVIGNLNIDGTLILDRSDSFTFAGDLSGHGTVIKDGTGTATLSGTISYTGDFVINAGAIDLTGQVITTSGSTSIDDSKLSVNGSLTSDVNVNSGGTLGGSGTVNGDVDVASGGTVSPGNSPGTLNVSGDFAFLSGSSYRVETLPTGVGDRISVTGNVTIGSGVPVNVFPYGGVTNYALSTNYVILSATGTITGAFSGVSVGDSNFAFLTPTLTYAPSTVTLRLSRNDVTFASLAQTDNETAVAGAVEGLPTNDPVYAAVLHAPLDGVPGIYDALSGDAHASIQSVGLASSFAFFDQIGARLSQLADGPQQVQLASLTTDAVFGAPGPNSDFWTEAFGSVGSLDAHAGAPGADYSRGGVSFGADAPIGTDARVGAAVGYNRGNINIDSRQSHADISSYDLALYGGVRTGDWVWRGALGGSWRSVDSHREEFVSSTLQRLRASYDARALTVQGELSRLFGDDHAYLEPFLNLTYVDLHTDGFNEHGGSAALIAAGEGDDVLFTTLGARAQHDIGAHAALFGSIGWRHASGDITPESNMAFSSDPGANFTVAGAPIAENAAAVEAGLHLAFPGLSVSASYRGEFAAHGEDQGGRVRLTWSF